MGNINVNKDSRNSNLELLRILAMFLIVLFHFSYHNFTDINLIASNPNNYIINFSLMFGKIGVDVFVLLSAYFMIRSKFTLKKFLILIGEMYFYSCLILFLFSTVLTPVKPIDYELIIRFLLPFSHSAYWFLTDYLILMILSPFLNKLLNSLTKNNYIILLISVLLLWSILPTFIGINTFDVNSLIWFFALYIVGGFIGLYVDISKLNMKKLILTLFALLTIIFAFSCILNIYTDFQFIKPFYKTLFQENNIFILFASILVLLIFLRRKSFSNRFINFIAGSALGIYLIHDNNILREYIWKTIFNVPSYYNSNYLLIFMIVTVITICVSCIVIDILRRVTVEKVWIRVVDKIDLKLSTFLINKTKLLESKLNYYLK